MKMFISMNYAFIAYRIGFNLSLIVFFQSFLKKMVFLVSYLLSFFFASSFVCYSSLPFYSSFHHFIAAFLLQSTGEYLIFSFLSNCLIFFFSFFHNFHLYVTLYVIFFLSFSAFP